MQFDDFLFSTLGEMGRYQKIQFLLVCLPTIIVSMHALSWTFAGISVPYRCALPEETKESPYYNESPELNLKTCTEGDNEVSIERWADQGVECNYYEDCQVNNITCDFHVFYRSKVAYTALDRWDIVCDLAFIKATIQASYYVGQMAGSMIFGVLGDKIGRKKVFFLAIVIQITCAYGVAVAPTWWLYAIFRAGTGFSHPGIFVIAVVIGMELVGPRYRKLASVITGAFFAIGQVFLGIEAYFITDYRWLHVVIASPALLFLTYWWIVPESARWLVSQRKFGEADVVLREAARVNKVELPENWWEDLDLGDEKSQTGPQKKYGMLDLFKTPQLKKRTLVAFYLWPVVSMVYYGMAMKANVLGGDIYINFIFGALIEIPALVVVFLTIDRFGRRLILSCGFFLAGSMLLLNFFLGDNVSPLVAISQMLVTKGAITATYASLYTYSPELFPTVIRNTAMGCCSTIARVGAISASYVAMWIVESYGKVYMIIPFGAFAVTAGLAVLLLLPETMGKPLPESIAEIEGKVVEAEMQPLSRTDPTEQTSPTKTA